MAIKLITSYGKKIGLPAFSSHTFSASVEVEVSDLAEVSSQVHHLYQLLQGSVDSEIIKTGFLPGESGSQHPDASGNGSAHVKSHGWKCSDKQRALILELVERQDREIDAVERFAKRRFGKGLAELRRKEASELISGLLSRQGSSNGTVSQRG